MTDKVTLTIIWIVSVSLILVFVIYHMGHLNGRLRKVEQIQRDIMEQIE